VGSRLIVVTAGARKRLPGSENPRWSGTDHCGAAGYAGLPVVCRAARYAEIVPLLKSLSIRPVNGFIEALLGTQRLAVNMAPVPLPRPWLIVVLCGLAWSAGEASLDDASVPRPVRLMAVGDSITAGADFFTSYRFPLWEKLFGAGYLVEFTGSQSSDTRIGPLAHEGYGGKNTEWLAATVPANFRAHPADIVLLHSGHNHSVEEHPVPGIVAATGKLIAGFREANPHVTVLLAQVIPAGKLPKYSYLPELNAALAELAARLDRPGQRVLPVDQSAGFDWKTDTVEDHVHPNAQGAEKMAQAWFEALRKILPPPIQAFAPRKITYRETDGIKLQLHVFDPPAAPAGKRPAIVFFFGGGWTHGTPIQFYPECRHFAGEGYVAISADYRVASTAHSTPFDSRDDAQAALAWVANHAPELGVDPARIVAAGASAGGHLAALCGLVPDACPAALVLWYPILDTGPTGYGHALFGDRFREASPLELASARTPPPTLLLFGDADPATPLATVHEFQTRVRDHGGRCELVQFPGGGHPLYAYREGGGPLRTQTLRAADEFLSSVFGTR
jgi:acetyl esterase